MKTMFGIEIEMVRHDWRKCEFIQASRMYCRCGGSQCKRRINHHDMGIELPDGWRLEGDCSIPRSPYGVEMVSPKLTMIELLSQLKTACSAMMGAGYEAGPPEFCGIHVSVSWDGKLGSKVLEKTRDWNREGTMPGQLYHDKLSRMRKHNVHWSCTVGSGKSNVVNQDSYKKRIEFRHLASSLDHKQIKRSMLGLLSTTRQ